MNNLLIQFNGIDVTRENRAYIENCFQSIFSLAPSESSVKFNFFETPEGISGGVLIVSQIKTFTVDCQEKLLKDVMKMMNIQVGKELKEWKKERFKIA